MLIINSTGKRKLDIDLKMSTELISSGLWQASATKNIALDGALFPDEK